MTSPKNSARNLRARLQQLATTNSEVTELQLADALLNRSESLHQELSARLLRTVQGANGLDAHMSRVIFGQQVEPNALQIVDFLMGQDSSKTDLRPDTLAEEYPLLRFRRMVHKLSRESSFARNYDPHSKALEDLLTLTVVASLPDADVVLMRNLMVRAISGKPTLQTFSAVTTDNRNQAELLMRYAYLTLFNHEISDRDFILALGENSIPNFLSGKIWYLATPPSPPDGWSSKEWYAHSQIEALGYEYDTKAGTYSEQFRLMLQELASKGTLVAVSADAEHEHAIQRLRTEFPRLVAVCLASVNSLRYSTVFLDRHYVSDRLSHLPSSSLSIKRL